MTRSKKSKKSNNNHQSNLSHAKSNKQKVVDENVDPENKQQQQQQQINNKILPKICLSCGILSREIPHECLAKKKICLKCNKRGHYSRVCQYSERQDNDDKNNNLSDTDDVDEKCLLKETKINEKKNQLNDKKKEVVDANTRINKMKEMANSLYKKGNFEDALTYYTKIIAECSNDASHYANRAACLMMTKNYKEALVDAKKSVDINPTFITGHVRVAKCLMILGKFMEAKICLNKISQIDPTNEVVKNEKIKLSKVQLCMEIMNESIANEKYNLALENINEILKISTHSDFYKIKKSECLAYIGNYEWAEQIANEVLQVDKTNIDAKFVLSLCLYQSNVNSAMDMLMEVLRAVPDHPKAMEIYKKAKTLIGKKHAGNVAYNKYNYAKAYSLYSEALKVDENNIGIAKKLYYKMAKASYKLKNYKQSIEDCSKALKIFPNNIDFLIHRGDSYMKICDYKSAVEDLTTALRLNPFSNECRHLLYEAMTLLKVSKSSKSKYHDILGVKKSASLDDIRKAYHEKAMLHHPDRHSNATQEQKMFNEKKFKDITQAYRKLTEKNSSGYDDDDDSDDEDDDFYMYKTGDFSAFIFTSLIRNFFG
ncbi:hypothetical protein HCN44_007633 [Aphidius gifuensis]|uniref:Uncharacterized protein n=2 Tax=Aphidius gifuensis TaxID=684658 RepID=A0A835CKV3_APHGI|nr:hypothetical protein HCN44_007633 [Aphidius gifuensis]